MHRSLLRRAQIGYGGPRAAYNGFCEQMESSDWDERDGRLRHEGVWSSAAGAAEIQLIGAQRLARIKMHRAHQLNHPSESNKL
jgi:hypothetical protein